MQKSLVHLDDILIDTVCQPIVDRIAEVVATDCFRIARVCLDISALAWILSQADDAITAANVGILGIEAFQYALIVAGLGAIMVLRSVFERAGGSRSRGQSEQSNPLREVMYIHRVITLLALVSVLIQTVLAPMDFASAALLAMQAFAAIALYMGACSNRPPKRCDYRLGNAWATASHSN
jgi:hypothetical protein